MTGMGWDILVFNTIKRIVVENMGQPLKFTLIVALSSMLFRHICPSIMFSYCIFLNCNPEHKSELAGGFEFTFCSFTKLAKRNICLIYRGFTAHSFYSWIFVLLFSLSSGFCKFRNSINRLDLCICNLYFC